MCTDLETSPKDKSREKRCPTGRVHCASPRILTIKHLLNKQNLLISISHTVAMPTGRQRSAEMAECGKGGSLWGFRSSKHLSSLRPVLGAGVSQPGRSVTRAETDLTKSAGSSSGLTPRESSTSFRIWSNSSESSPKASELGSLPLSVRNFRSTVGGRREAERRLRDVTRRVFHFLGGIY